MTKRYKAELERALVALRAGQIVCLPTESTYGLAVDPSNARALDELSELKGRPVNAPFALIAGSAEQARAWTGLWPEAASSLAAEDGPGPLTLILPPGPQVLPCLP